jgi:hypothetical protein
MTSKGPLMGYIIKVRTVSTIRPTPDIIPRTLSTISCLGISCLFTRAGFKIASIFMGQCTSVIKNSEKKPELEVFPEVFYFDSESGVHFQMVKKGQTIARALDISPGTRLNVHALTAMMNSTTFLIVGGFDSLLKENSRKVVRVNIENHTVEECAELPYRILGGKLHVVNNLVFLIGAKREDYVEKMHWPGHSNPFQYQWIVAKSPGPCPIWVFHNKLNTWTQVRIEPYMKTKCKRNPDSIFGAGHGLINGKIYFVGGIVQDKEGIWKSNRKVYSFHIESRYIEVCDVRFKTKQSILVPKVSYLGNKCILVAGGLRKDDEGVRPSSKVYIIKNLMECVKMKNLEEDITLLSSFQSFNFKQYSIHVDFPNLHVYNRDTENWEKFDLRTTPLRDNEYEQVRPPSRMVEVKAEFPEINGDSV